MVGCGAGRAARHSHRLGLRRWTGAGPGCGGGRELGRGAEVDGSWAGVRRWTGAGSGCSSAAHCALPAGTCPLEGAGLSAELSVLKQKGKCSFWFTLRGASLIKILPIAL